MLAAEMGESWRPLLALAFDLGCDTVMTDWEAELLQTPEAQSSAPVVQSQPLTPEALWEALP